MQPFSEAAIRDAFSQGEADFVLLVTVTADGWDDMAKITDRPDPVVFAGKHYSGFISRGELYQFVPFNFSWGGAASDEPARQATLEVASAPLLVDAVRRAPSYAQVYVDVEMVRASAPDVVERALRSAKVPRSSLEGPKMIFSLAGRSLADEYACAARYVAARVPGLFA